jgi:hypothetical protein
VVLTLVISGWDSNGMRCVQQNVLGLGTGGLGETCIKVKRCGEVVLQRPLHEQEASYYSTFRRRMSMYSTHASMHVRDVLCHACPTIKHCRVTVCLLRP